MYIVGGYKRQTVHHPGLAQFAVISWDAKGVIYCIPCKDCDKSHIEETGRTLWTRLTHCRNCSNEVQVLHNAPWKMTTRSIGKKVWWLDWKRTFTKEESKKHCTSGSSQISNRIWVSMSVRFGTALSPISSHFLHFMHSKYSFYPFLVFFHFHSRWEHIYNVFLSSSVLPNEG